MSRRQRPTDIGAIYDNYINGNHSDVRAAFVGLAPADAAALAASIIEHAGEYAATHIPGEAARVMLELCRYFRRWTV